jgi:hypothetical protein
MEVSIYDRIRARFGFVGLALVVAVPVAARAAVTFTDTTNITVANARVESGGNTSDNPLIVNGPVGAAISYTTSSPSGPLLGYDESNLDDDDVGAGVGSDGIYTVLNEGRLGLDFPFPTAPPILVGSIAIYNGYGDRTDGNYVLENGLGGATLGAWMISGTNGATNDSVDSFWLTFNAPVYTSTLVLIASGVESGTPSYREIDIFAPVPEPSGVLLGGLAFCWLVAQRGRATPERCPECGNTPAGGR